MKWQRLATIKRRVIMTEEAAALGSNAQRKQKQQRGKKLRICCKSGYEQGD